MNNQNSYLKKYKPFRHMRYWAYLIATIFALVMPFITFNDGNHIFLLNFGDKQLHLAGIAYDMQELYVMPFVVMFLFIFIFFITVLGGRVWCGWACPQTIFRVIYRDWIETKLLKIRKNISNKQKEPKSNGLKKLIAIIIWSIFSFVAASDFVLFFVPYDEFFVYLFDFENHATMNGVIISIVVFLVYDIIWLKEDFCIYVCPYSRIQSVLYDDDTIMAVYSNKRGGVIYDGEEKLINKQKELPQGSECTTCEKCVAVCPTHIDIRQGLQLECINCLECVDACTVVQSKFERPSLISWSSEKEVENKGKTQYFRQKIIAYIILLVFIIAMMIKMGSTKENMLLNINRTTQLYSIKADNHVENYYTFLFQNTDNKAHKYTFEVEGHSDITIKRPKKAFNVPAGKAKKKVIVLSTTATLANDATKDTPIAIKIKAYAVDDQENIVVYRDTVFVYPRSDQFKK